MDQYSDIVALSEYLGPRADGIPELPEVEKLTARVLRVLGGNPGRMQLQGTNTYIVGTGPERLLVDTGQGQACWAQRVVSLSQDSGFRICKVLLTHWHLDHTGGVQDLLHMDPGLQGAIHKYDPDPTQEPIADGDIFTVEGATLQAVFTPGHSADHICFVLEEEAAIFTGDTVLGHGTTATEDLEEHMQALQRLLAFNCQVAYPGHGAVILELGQKLEQELGLRLRREQQVIRALENIGLGRRGTKGATTAADLTTAVFGQLPGGIAEKFAQGYISDILMKMARERRVGFRSHQGSEKHWFLKPGQ